ncbi:MAG: methyltransferase domain-containing protein [Actinomycetota bacterium]
MTMSDTTEPATEPTTDAPVPTPGADLDPDKMPGHWLLARMGKRVLRPGGRKMTDTLLSQLAIGTTDDVVELAPGLGVTAELILDRSPAGYTAVERDPDAVAAVRRLLRNHRDSCSEGTALDTGLADASADVVLGEAYLTMQSQEHKERMVAEAFRVLRSGGRYGLHELCLRPDGLADAKQDEVRGDLTRAIHVGARPRTAADWTAILEGAGFEITHRSTVPMGLLDPRRLIDDEGIAGVAKIVFNVLRTPAARRRVRTMRATFGRHRDHLGAVCLVATKPIED